VQEHGREIALEALQYFHPHHPKEFEVSTTDWVDFH
jgi:hypothetical protein